MKIDNFSFAVTGHRPDKLDGYRKGFDGPRCKRIRKWFYRQFESVTWLHLGMALGVDQLAADCAVIMDVPFTACVPFPGQERLWKIEDQRLYHKLMAHATEIVFVSESTPENNGHAAGLMQARNVYMVDKTDALFTVWNGTSGGTANCVKYAESKGKEIIRFSDF